jgi:hypothetical protein
VDIGEVRVEIQHQLRLERLHAVIAHQQALRHAAADLAGDGDLQGILGQMRSRRRAAGARQPEAGAPPVPAQRSRREQKGLAAVQPQAMAGEDAGVEVVEAFPALAAHRAVRPRHQHRVALVQDAVGRIERIQMPADRGSLEVFHAGSAVSARQGPKRPAGNPVPHPRVLTARAFFLAYEG